MQNTIWKLTALAGVVGIGFLVVLQAQRGLMRPEANPVAELVPADKDDLPASAAAEADDTSAPPAPANPEAFPTQVEPDEFATRPRTAEPEAAAFEEAPEANPFAAASRSTPVPAEDMDAPPVRRRGLDFRETEPVPQTEPAEVAQGRLEPVPDPFDDQAEPAAGESNASPGAPGESTARGLERPAIELAGHEEPAAKPARPQDQMSALDQEPESLPNEEPVSPGPQLLAPGPATLASAEDVPSDSKVKPAGKELALRDPADDPDSGFGGEPSYDLFGSEREPEPFGADPPAQPLPAAGTPAAEPAFGDELNPFGAPAAEAMPANEGEPALELPEPTSPASPENSEPDAKEEPSADSPFGNPQPLPAPSQLDSPFGTPPFGTPPAGAMPADASPAEPTPEPVDQPFGGLEPVGPTARPTETPPAREDEPKAKTDTPLQPTPEPIDQPFGAMPLDEPVDDSQPQPIRQRARPTEMKPALESEPADDLRPVPRAMPAEGQEPLPLPEPSVPRAQPSFPAEPEPKSATSDPPESSNEPTPLDVPDEARVLPTPRPTLTGDGTVGDKSPGGAQRPQLKIEKLAPPNAVLGQPLIYEIAVRNIGDSAAHEVIVEDRIPKGSELSGTDPQAELADKTLIWKLGTMHPGDERKIRVKVVPVAEGQIGSVATVNFVAEVAAKTVITAAKLKFDLTAPPQVRVGEHVPFVFKVTNTGTADARKIVIRDLIPESLQHPDGNDLEYEMGTLAPGRSKEVKLTLVAAKPGETVNKAVVTADGGVNLEAEAAVEILGSALHLSRTGPKKRYLGRAAVYETTVTNQSARPIGGARVFESVPKGMDFVEATAGGQFDPVRRVVAWQLEALSPGQSKVLQIKLMPKTLGVQAGVVQVVEANGMRSQVRSETEIAGIPAVTADLTGITGPIAVGEQVAYQVQVRNRGTDAGNNVRVRLELPPELALVSAEGAQVDGQGGVEFPVLATVEPRAESTFKIVLKGTAPGDVRLKVHLEADHMEQPLSQEEQVVIFADQR